MKSGPHLLINVLLVAAGFFIYDALRSDVARPSLGALVPDEHTDARPARTFGPDLRALETLVQHNSARLQALGETLASLRRDADDEQSAAPMNVLRPQRGDVVGEGEPRFDETKLESIRAYMDEIARRKHVEIQRSLIESEMLRQDLGLTREEQEAVVAATLDYRTRATELMRKRFARDEQGQRQRRAVFERLRAAYRSDISQLIPADAVERIMGSSISPAHAISLSAQPPSDADR